MLPSLGFGPREGNEGEVGFPWCKITLGLTESNELFSCMCVGRVCFVQCWKESPCCRRGLVALVEERASCCGGGDLSAIATPPAAPASPGNLPLPRAPTREQKTESLSAG